MVRPDNKDHYRPYADSLGVHTTEADRPSLKLASRCQGAWKSEVRGVQCRSESVRSVVHCSECAKPRCVFAARNMTAAQNAALQLALEDAVYVCGAPLFPPDHHLYSTLVVREDAECSTCIEPSYCSARCTYEQVCYVCGDNNLLPLLPELKNKYQSVHPVCAQCKARGCAERTRGEKKARKRKHQD